jgi:hypothetical protein
MIRKRIVTNTDWRLRGAKGKRAGDEGKFLRPSHRLSATIRKDESPEGERKLDGSLRALGLEDGNGFWTRNIPRRRESAIEDGSSRPNGLEEKFRVASKK